ncbi:MAG TPA: heat-inducible transcriptional repressor HrcA [Gemmatimonadaceae bacterium]|nr:heat-inducible transcriptional repressor HrcA [Gemmatimonadaceae bacterium]
MSRVEPLSKREQRVLEAVIQTYVQTAEPAGSRMLSRRFGLGVSPATIRNTMSDLEEKGFLFHPHTSAGRVPTNKAYRAYVDALISQVTPVESAEHERLAEVLTPSDSPIETILRRAAQSLGVLTQELGIAMGPRLATTVLRSLDLVRLSDERLLMVLALEGGAVRTVFVEVAGSIAASALTEVTKVLNERLAGLTLEDIRVSLSQRLRDSVSVPEARELLNIFVQEADSLFDDALAREEAVVLGQASVLAEQPEFAAVDRMRRLIELTERPQALAETLRRRGETSGISITIGNEHSDERLRDFTVVTAEYHAGSLTGVIGVIGPTRMPYQKVISLVNHTSRLLSELLP